MMPKLAIAAAGLFVLYPEEVEVNREVISAEGTTARPG
jgi:hypothetical protein